MYSAIIYLSINYRIACLSVCLSVYLACLFVCLSVCLLIELEVFTGPKIHARPGRDP